MSLKNKDGKLKMVIFFVCNNVCFLSFYREVKTDEVHKKGKPGQSVSMT